MLPWPSSYRTVAVSVPVERSTLTRSTGRSPTFMKNVLFGSRRYAVVLVEIVEVGRFGGGGGFPNTTRHDNNQLLVSIAHAMGADDLTSFGDASGKPGPLPSLV
jgi:hypothetical protein